MTNKKIILPIITLFIILIWVLTYSFLNKNNINSTSKKTQELKYSSKRNEISLSDIYNSYLNNDYKTNNEVLLKWQDFLKNLNKNNSSKITNVVDWWITLEYLNELVKNYSEYKRNFTLKLNISDYITKKPISNWIVYLNWVKLWEFKNWNFEWKFPWLMWIELFNITVRSWEYWDWFLVLNSINSNWNLLMWDLLLKKSQTKKVDLSKDLSIEFNIFSIKLNNCSLVDKNWTCYNKIANLKTNYISSKEANNNYLSLNMNALDNNNLVYLRSWWMAFLEFITDNWEILQLKNWETFDLTYKITQFDIDNMWELSDTNWYWYFDKNAWIWLKSEAKWIIDNKNLTITFKADKLY